MYIYITLSNQLFYTLHYIIYHNFCIYFIFIIDTLIFYTTL
ncbi:hypothetical protein [Staphylococcus phage vB_SauM-V1SA19]|nr:hypothetical protein [Staphylococcus phage vB_SauM-V1SA19]